MQNLDRVFAYKWSSIYQQYVLKVERKGRSIEELNAILEWLTGYDYAGLQKQINSSVDLKTFFEEAPLFNPNASKITGSICGYKLEEIEDPLMQKIRYMDKIVDELAKGKAVEKICRQ